MNVVQIERQRIRIGDSDTKWLDGLVPVTRLIKEGSDYEQASRRPKVPANTGEWEGAYGNSEEEEAGQVGRKGWGAVKHRGKHPWEELGGAVALPTCGASWAFRGVWPGS